MFSNPTYNKCKEIVRRRAQEGNKFIAAAIEKAHAENTKIPRSLVEQWALETDAVHYCLKFLSNRCNYARTWDGKGFCARTAAAGKALAGMSHVPESRFWEAARIVYKFRGQLNEDPATKALMDGPLKPIMTSIANRRKHD